MEYFKPAILSSSKRPELQPDESLLIQQGKTGLYEGKNKLEHYQDGVCYLTSHRIIYVDEANSLEYSIEIRLQDIKSVDSYAGFLRSSPKIILQLEKTEVGSSLTTEHTSVWACSVCFFSNPGSAYQCELCGVKKSGTETTVRNVGSESAEACGVCTFINHSSLLQCEMCHADLCTAPLASPIAPAEVRISFRKSGQAGFLSKLKLALAQASWLAIDQNQRKEANMTQSRGVGISAIQDRIEKTTLEANETMTDAFQDLDRLMTKATEMVKLTESIANKMSKEPTDQLPELRNHLLKLGIVSPVTKDSAGSIYHQELARELADFLEKLLKQDDMKSLTDIYCLFNRARCVALISPEDLFKASQELERLKLPFQLRTFSSGLSVIQPLNMDDTRAAHRILKHVKSQGGCLTALQLAELEKLALAVATEQLVVAEHMGLLCRDQGPAGLAFYENLFQSS
ncbi:EAP30/Vps36 family-domain-containing protein [Sporodiniella umbellata]|nr:EAP30/Vps36 family-domain-containing protein [Sporodiniella umbellata]